MGENVGTAKGGFAAAANVSVNRITDTAKAYTKGNMVTADALAIRSGNDSKITTGAGAIALGLSQNSSAIAGSFMYNAITDKNEAYAEDAVLTLQGSEKEDASLTVEADNAAKITNIAASGSGAAKGSAIAGQISLNWVDNKTDAHVKGGCLTADEAATIAANLIEGETTSSLEDTTVNSGGALSVLAKNGSNATLGVGSAAVGGNSAGASIGVMVNQSEVAATLTGDKDKSHTITADGITVQADNAYNGAASDTDDKTARTVAVGFAGGASLSAGSGIGAAVDVQTYNGHTYAGIADGASLKNASSVTVNADSKEHLTSVAATLAGGAGTFAGAAGAHSVSTDTKAYLGQSEVTEAGDVSVTAKDETELKTVAGSGAASGNTGVGLTAAVEVVNKKASAIVGDDVKVTGSSLTVKAENTSSSVTNAAGLGAGGTASLSGTVGVNALKTTTKAYAAGSSQLSAKTANAEGIAVTASDETTLKGDNGGVSIGISGGSAGAAIGVTNISKDTEAFLGGRAAIDTAGKTKISAKNQESFVNVTVQAAGGLYAALAGSDHQMNVTNLSAVTKAYTGDDVSFNQADKKGSDVTVEAKHNIDKMTSAVAGAAVGAGALGAAVDIGTIRTQTNAFLGENNKLHTDGALVIDAADHMEDISTNAIAAAVGGFGVAGSVSVYNFGSIMSDSDIAMLSGKTSKDGGESSMDDWVNGEINKSQTGNAMGVYQTDALTDVKNKLETKFQSETPDMGEKGTLAQIGNGSTVTADNVRIKADDKLSVSNLMGNVSAGGSATGISVNVVRTDTLTQAKTGENSSIRSVGDVQISAGSDHQMKSDIVGASLSGGISAQGTEETWMDKSIVRALAGTGSSITSGGQTAITSSNVRSLDAKLTGASVALSGALNGAVITADVSGSSEAGTGNGASIDAEEEAKIEAEADTKLSAKALGAALGTYAGTGTGVAFSSEVAAKADVGNQTAIHGKNTSITAKNTPTLEARAVSAGLGIAGVGSTVSEAHSKDKALVRVGGGAKLLADEALRIRALMENRRTQRITMRTRRPSLARVVSFPVRSVWLLSIWRRKRKFPSRLLPR